ncbi:uncharacterized protein LOC125551696 [Triticum urartu]|uniref:uncharacterized protein LOC125551696 n=1 Tax=Triticum urartu TaxID=4572 RepID=UPI0020449F1B|nr:uncharacterized protein LOC125551696 [Triticum urartu]
MLFCGSVALLHSNDGVASRWDSNYLGIMLWCPLSLMVRPCTLAMVVATKSQTESLRSGTIQAYLPLSWRCLRTTTTKFWHRLQALSQATQERLRLKVGLLCRRAAAATYVSSKKGATLEEHNDTGCSGARANKGTGPLETTDTEVHARHADHQTLGSDPTRDAAVHAAVAAAATCHDLRASDCSAAYKRDHRGPYSPRRCFSYRAYLLAFYV